MASADLKEELECSVCLDIYTDPVTLKCGHNFCQDCIGRVLDSQERSGGYFCPDCREEFQDRPALRRNITLRNIVENVLSTHPDQASSGVFCTYCIHTPVPALKSCLLCEASLCYDHLRVHSKSPEHVLCDPTTYLENRKCSVHKAGGLNFLSDIMSGVNVEKCTGTHVYPHSTTQGKGHFNAEPSWRRPQPTPAIQPSRNHPQPFPTIQHSLHQAGGPNIVSDMSGVNVEKCTGTHVYPHSTTKGKGHFNVEPSWRRPQPSSTIQPPRRYPQPSPTIQHSHRQAGGPNILSDIMSGVNVQRCTDTRVYPHSTTKEIPPFIAKPSRKYPEPSPTIQHSHCQAGGPYIRSVQQTSGFADIVLDVSTASNYLDISEDGKTVYRSPYKVFPETPGSFRCSQVMSIQSFSSGRHYWEVDVGESPIWKVGMCYPSIDKRGFQSGFGSNNKSWCLEKRKFNECSFVHDSYQFPLPGGVYSNRIRIDLDYEAGRISFYDLCDPIRHLHTFTTTFTEPLHAGLRIGKDSCIRITGRESEVKSLHRDW